MALKALLASAAVSALSADLQKEYRAPTDAELAANPALKDQMILDVAPEGGYGLDNVEALKTNLGNEKTRADKAEGAAAKFKDLPADTTKRLARLVELEKLDPEKDAEKLATAKFEQMKTDLIKQHEEEKAPLVERSKVLFNELDKAQRIAQATKAITDAGGNVDVLLPHVLSSTKFEEKDGKFLVQVIDPATGSLRIGDAHGNGMSLTQLVDDFKSKDAFAPLFNPSGKSGGGAPTTSDQKAGSGLGAKTKSDLGDMNARAEFIDKNGMEAYIALPNAAPAAA